MIQGGLHTPITSSEILSEPFQTQDECQHDTRDATQPIQAVPFGKALPCTNSLNSVNHSPFPLLLSPTPTSNPANALSDSPQNQPPSPHH